MYRIGLVGTGYWGANIANSLEAAGNARIAWLCDVNPENLAAAARRHPQAQTTARLDELLADGTVEAVGISTPTTTHHAVATAALEAGKHVLVEKPITSSADDAMDLIRRAEATGRILMVGHVFEYNSSIQAV